MKTRLKIISGGQTGVDRAALDWALAHKVPHGGWCPRGRRAEDGVIPRRYRLRETWSSAYAVRTRQNVEEADATVVFTATGDLRGGTRWTVEIAKQFGKPWLWLAGSKLEIGEAAARLTEFIGEHEVRVLNVAGPRGSEQPEAARFARAVLEKMWAAANQ